MKRGKVQVREGVWRLRGRRQMGRESPGTCAGPRCRLLLSALQTQTMAGGCGDPLARRVSLCMWIRD
ncbi:hypothetical protein E2C01_026172 [Portunus trituberculatus]|uniref:Uncharacterized protein n=1 Tax=Portunus trituberculatus TaxID=210409 RepID=A0A5B7EF11_PORTR|nr:hypothetical protein [Portunus trituberculatus]